MKKAMIIVTISLTFLTGTYFGYEYPKHDSVKQETIETKHNGILYQHKLNKKEEVVDKKIIDKERRVAKTYNDLETYISSLFDNEK